MKNKTVDEWQMPTYASDPFAGLALWLRIKTTSKVAECAVCSSTIEPGSRVCEIDIVFTQKLFCPSCSQQSLSSLAVAKKFEGE